MSTPGRQLDPSERTQHDRTSRVDEILRLGRAHASLVRVLRRHFTADELGRMFDALPATTGDRALATLADAVGSAWAERYGTAPVDGTNDGEDGE